MLKPLLIVAAVAALVSAGVVEGIWSNRWGASEDSRVAAARLGGVPLNVGPWRGKDLEIDAKVLRVAEAQGNVSRVYTNEKTGESVTVLLLCGPSGPIASHTPDVCYAGTGYEMKGSPRRNTLTFDGSEPSTYWSARFEKPAAGEVPLQVCWAWGVDGNWAASDVPRADFALRRVLYKLYATRRVPPAGRDGAQDSDPIPRFLKVFLPEVKKALAAPPG